MGRKNKKNRSECRQKASQERPQQRQSSELMNARIDDLGSERSSLNGDTRQNLTVVNADELNGLLQALSRFSNMASQSTTMPTLPPASNNIQQFSSLLNEISSAFERDNTNGHQTNNIHAGVSHENDSVPPAPTSTLALCQPPNPLVTNAPNPTVIAHVDLCEWNDTSYMSPPPMMHRAPTARVQRDIHQVSWWPPQTTTSQMAVASSHASNAIISAAIATSVTNATSFAGQQSAQMNSTWLSCVGATTTNPSIVDSTQVCSTFDLPITTPGICSTKFVTYAQAQPSFAARTPHPAVGQTTAPASAYSGGLHTASSGASHALTPLQARTYYPPHQPQIYGWQMENERDLAATAPGTLQFTTPSHTAQQPTQHYIAPHAAPQQHYVRFPQIKITGKYTEHAFVQLESWLEANAIFNDDQRLMYLKMAIDGDTHTYVKSALDRPPPTHKYESLKAAILRAHSETEQRRMQNLISGISLGNRRPTQMLAQMRDQYRGDMDHPVIRSLFLSRLPDTTRQILCGMIQNRPHNVPEISTEEVAHMADSIIDGGSSNQSVNAVSASQSSEFSELKKQMETLASRVEQLLGAVGDKHKNRTAGGSQQPSDVCYFHRAYGKNKHANKKCVEPCKLHQEWLAAQAANDQQKN